MNPYCETLPNQLKAWDATALRRFMECPRKHQLMQLEGWDRKGNIHLEFGRLYHSAAEMFDKLRLDGVSQEDATIATFQHYCKETIGALQTSYMQVWRCTDTAEKIGKRGGVVRNTTRCPLSKAPQFTGHRFGEPCPECGRPTIDDWEMICEDKNKNRDTLLRTILYYCDTADERVVPYSFPDGRPAVELTFRLPLPLESPDGDPYLLCGNIDGLVDFLEEVMPRERKTTKNTPGGYFFDRYAPDVQIDTYDLACWLLYSDLLDPKPHGIMVEVTQVTPNFTRIERQIINVPEERRAEWLKEIQWWIKEAERCALNGFWPKNTSACSANGGCPMREICRLAPSSRQAFLKGDRFEKREIWNPLDVR